MSTLNPQFSEAYAEVRSADLVRKVLPLRIRRSARDDQLLAHEVHICTQDINAALTKAVHVARDVFMDPSNLEPDATLREVDDSVRLPRGNRLVRLHRWLNGNELTDLYQALILDIAVHKRGEVPDFEVPMSFPYAEAAAAKVRAERALVSPSEKQGYGKLRAEVEADPEIARLSQKARSPFGRHLTPRLPEDFLTRAADVVLDESQKIPVTLREVRDLHAGVSTNELLDFQRALLLEIRTRLLKASEVSQ